MTTKPYAEQTLHELLKGLPKSIDVFNAHLLDTCCGEHRSLAQACQDANADLNEIVAALAKL
ncbi:MAG TPA: DUF542 domain-containing protein [Stenomitos sp.]